MPVNPLRRSAAAAAAATALGAGLVFGSAAPASASLGDCPPGALCAWTQTNYGGTPGKVYYNNGDLLQYPSFDNAKSVYNNGTSGCSVTIWNQRYWQGISVNLPRGTGYGDLQHQNPPFYLNIASNRWC
jgi:Peptidase inhibitor family I36